MKTTYLAAILTLALLATFGFASPIALNLSSTHYNSYGAAIATCAVCTKNVINTTTTYGTVPATAAGSQVYYAYKNGSALTVYNVLITKAQPSLSIATNYGTLNQANTTIVVHAPLINNATTYNVSYTLTGNALNSLSYTYYINGVQHTTSGMSIQLNQNLLHQTGNTTIQFDSAANPNYTADDPTLVIVPTLIGNYIPITYTNYQPFILTRNTPLIIGATTKNVIIGFNAIPYQANEACTMDNVEYFFKNGTLIPSWMEGQYNNEMAANVACTSASSVNALSASANLTTWVSYPWPSSFLPPAWLVADFLNPSPTTGTVTGVSNIILNANPSIVPNSNDITLSMWIDPSNYHFTGSSKYVQRVFESYIDAGNGYQLTLGNGPNTETNTISFAILHGSVAYQGYVTANTLLANTWYNVAFTWQHATNTVVVYINGVSQPFTVDPTNAIGFGSPPSVTSIGQRPDAQGPYNGSLSNIQIYTTALTAGQMSTLYGEGKAGAPIAGTNVVGYYPLDGNAIDFSPYSNNGVFNGGQYINYNNTSNTIYMGFAPTTTNLLNTLTTGEAPQLSCNNPSNSVYGCAAGQYAEYDDGAMVFNGYWNFAGTATPAGWVNTANGLVIDNGIYQHPTTSLSQIVTSATYNYGPWILDTLQESVGPAYTGSGAGWAIGYNAMTVTFDTNCNMDGWGGNCGSFIGAQESQVSPILRYNGQTWNVLSTYQSNAVFGTFSNNYNMKGTSYGSGIHTLIFPVPIGIGFGGAISGNNAIFQWIRFRNIPPNDIYPATSIGSLANVPVANAILPAQAYLDYGQSVILTASWTATTPNYAVTWYSGASSSCASDTTVVATYSGISITSNQISVAPTSNTFYCYSVSDASTTSFSPTTSNIIVSANALSSTGWVVSMQVISEGSLQTLTANAAGGTGPFQFNIVVYNNAGSLVYNSLSPFNSLTGNVVTFTEQSAWGVGMFTANVYITDSATNAVTVGNTLSYTVVGPLTCQAPIFPFTLLSGTIYPNGDSANTMSIYIQAAGNQSVYSGSMYGYEMFNSVTTANIETYYPVTGNIVTGAITNNAFTFVSGNGLKANIPGNYLITFSMSVNDTSHDNWVGGAVLVNGVGQHNIASDTGTASTGHLPPTTIAASGIVYLHANDIVQFGVKDEIMAPSTINIQHATMSLARLDGQINGTVTVLLNGIQVGAIQPSQSGGAYQVPIANTVELLYSTPPSVVIQCIGAGTGGGGTYIIQSPSINTGANDDGDAAIGIIGGGLAFAAIMIVMGQRKRREPKSPEITVIETVSHP